MTDCYRVLFVCTGNTCRWVMPAQVPRRELADAGLPAEVASARLPVSAAGQPADQRAQEVLAQPHESLTYLAQSRVHGVLLGGRTEYLGGDRQGILVD